ncbi:MAG: hypothetical protein ACUVUP_03935 [Thermaceae bacterium]
MRLISPGSFGLGLGLLLFPALGFSLWGFFLALAFGALGGLGVYGPLGKGRTGSIGPGVDRPQGSLAAGWGFTWGLICLRRRPRRF